VIIRAGVGVVLVIFNERVKLKICYRITMYNTSISFGLEARFALFTFIHLDTQKGSNCSVRRSSITKLQRLSFHRLGRKNSRFVLPGSLELHRRFEIRIRPIVHSRSFVSTAIGKLILLLLYLCFQIRLNFARRPIVNLSLTVGVRSGLLLF